MLTDEICKDPLSLLKEIDFYFSLRRSLSSPTVSETDIKILQADIQHCLKYNGVEPVIPEAELNTLIKHLEENRRINNGRT